jgi:hypothetical protein
MKPKQKLRSKAAKDADTNSPELRQRVRQSEHELLGIARQLEVWAREPDSDVSRPAFQALTALFHEIHAWLWFSALLAPASLGALLRRGVSEDDAHAKYERGEHAAAWAGIELARIYKQIQAELGSRSKHSINRLRDIRFGFKLGGSDSEANPWFCAEYDRKADYRPTGEMAARTARKIGQIRRIKDCRSQWRQYASMEFVDGQLRLRKENEIEDFLGGCVQTDIVRGEALKLLDALPAFGGPDDGALEAWRKFVRRRLLTQQVISEFDLLFPQSRRKLDGVVTATLRCAWRAVGAGGEVLLPKY